MPRILTAALAIIALAAIAAGTALADTQHLPIIIRNDTAPVATITATPTTAILDTPTPTSTPTATPTNTPTLTPTATTVQPGPCPCDADTLNCADFSDRASAQACYDHCVAQGAGDIHRLDQNDDGLACESLPFGWSVWR